VMCIIAATDTGRYRRGGLLLLLTLRQLLIASRGWRWSAHCFFLLLVWSIVVLDGWMDQLMN